MIGVLDVVFPSSVTSLQQIYGRCFKHIIAGQEGAGGACIGYGVEVIIKAAQQPPQQGNGRRLAVAPIVETAYDKCIKGLIENPSIDSVNQCVSFAMQQFIPNQGTTGVSLSLCRCSFF